MIRIVSSSSSTTRRIGYCVARYMVRSSRKTKRVILLSGDLGGGKTTFVKGFLHFFDIAARGASPTFVLAKRYSLFEKNVRHIDSIYHIDAYRLRSFADASLVGLPAMLADERAFVLIEWPQRLWKKKPRHALAVSFSYGKGRNERILSFS